MTKQSHIARSLLGLVARMIKRRNRANLASGVLKRDELAVRGTISDGCRTFSTALVSRLG